MNFLGRLKHTKHQGRCSFVFLPEEQLVNRNLKLACPHGIPLTLQPLKGLIRILENILIIFHTVCLTPIPLYLTGSSIDQTDYYRKCKSTLVGTYITLFPNPSIRVLTRFCTYIGPTLSSSIDIFFIFSSDFYILYS